MGGFLSLYDETDRVELGGGYYVDIRRYLSHADTARAQRVMVPPRYETKAEQDKDGKPGTVTTAVTVDQQAYDREIMVAAIDSWNLTDRDGNPLPLPPFVPPTQVTGDDAANKVRRESIAKLPAFAATRILKRISDNEKRGADEEAAFPSSGDGGAAAA